MHVKQYAPSFIENMARLADGNAGQLIDDDPAACSDDLLFVQFGKAVARFDRKPFFKCFGHCRHD